MSTVSSPNIDAATELRIERSLERRATGALGDRERRTELLFAVAILAAAVALALFAPAARPFSLPLAVLFVVAFAAVQRVEFVLGEVRCMPSQLVFVPMLLLLPVPLVPLMVIAA